MGTITSACSLLHGMALVPETGSCNYMLSLPLTPAELLAVWVLVPDSWACPCLSSSSSAQLSSAHLAQPSSAQLSSAQFSSSSSAQLSSNSVQPFLAQLSSVQSSLSSLNTNKSMVNSVNPVSETARKRWFAHETCIQLNYYSSTTTCSCFSPWLPLPFLSEAGLLHPCHPGCPDEAFPHNPGFT